MCEIRARNVNELILNLWFNFEHNTTYVHVRRINLILGNTIFIYEW